MLCPTSLTDLFLFKSIFLIILNYMCFWALECQDLGGLKLQIPLEVELLQAFVSYLDVGNCTCVCVLESQCALLRKNRLSRHCSLTLLFTEEE